MPEAEEDLAYWKATGNKRIMRRITKLLEDILQHPFTGIGKPEPLKGDLHGVWSRRITDEHPLCPFVSNGQRKGRQPVGMPLFLICVENHDMKCMI